MSTNLLFYGREGYYGTVVYPGVLLKYYFRFLHCGSFVDGYLLSVIVLRSFSHVERRTLKLVDSEDIEVLTQKLPTHTSSCPQSPQIIGIVFFNVSIDNW